MLLRLFQSPKTIPIEKLEIIIKNLEKHLNKEDLVELKAIHEKIRQMSDAVGSKGFALFENTDSLAFSDYFDEETSEEEKNSMPRSMTFSSFANTARAKLIEKKYEALNYCIDALLSNIQDRYKLLNQSTNLKEIEGYYDNMKKYQSIQSAFDVLKPNYINIKNMFVKKLNYAITQSKVTELPDIQSCGQAEILNAVQIYINIPRTGNESLVTVSEHNPLHDEGAVRAAAYAHLLENVESWIETKIITLALLGGSGKTLTRAVYEILGYENLQQAQEQFKTSLNEDLQCYANSDFTATVEKEIKNIRALADKLYKTNPKKNVCEEKSNETEAGNAAQQITERRFKLFLEHLKPIRKGLSQTPKHINMKMWC